ncbi:MAG: hypothetical protein LBR17_05855 [Bacteroidales bacterium]|jgi:hypothetical protein|nr:hypothetical protein [Bacteroidales bacterium]
MKKLLLVLISIVLLPYMVIGQTTREKPSWVNGFFEDLPASVVKSFDASASNEDEAKNKALLEVYKWQTGSTGTGIDIKIIDGKFVINGGDALTVKARVIDQFIEQEGKYRRSYILVQIAKNPSFEFDDISSILKKMNKRKNPLWTGNSYWEIGILSISYPFALGFPVFCRYGGTMGIGFSAFAGISFSTDENSETVAYFEYNINLRLYPYKNFFLSVGYGTLGSEARQVYNDADGRFSTAGARQGEGILIQIGYDAMFGSSDDVIGTSSLSVGLGYDMFWQSWQPRITATIGVGIKNKK